MMRQISKSTWVWVSSSTPPSLPPLSPAATHTVRLHHIYVTPDLVHKHSEPCKQDGPPSEVRMFSYEECRNSQAAKSYPFYNWETFKKYFEPPYEGVDLSKILRCSSWLCCETISGSPSFLSTLFWLPDLLDSSWLFQNH